MAQPDEPSKGNTEEVLTQKEYAERKGWSKQYVNQLVKRGRIPLKDGKIDPASADAALARDKDPARNPAYRATAPDSGTSGQAPPQLASQALQGSFSKARTVREHYRALREKLEYEQQSGNLVSVDGIKSAVETLTIELRASIRFAAKEIGSMLASKYHLNEREMVTVTTEAVDKALTELSDKYKKRVMSYKERSKGEPDD